MFGRAAQGDSTPNFTSGVGVRTATELLVFDGYVGAPVSGFDAGDGGSVNFVYKQAFDPVTSQNKGPATPLFPAPDGAGFTLEDVSIAPSGQIALGFNYGGFQGVRGGAGGTLYAAFLSPSVGAAPVILQLESAAIWGQPHVIWSAAGQEFVFSWMYVRPGFGYSTRVAKFLPDGRGAGGNSDIVPTVAGGGVSIGGGAGSYSGAAGTSGSLLGVAYYDNSPYLTVLDALGNQVGSSVRLSNGTSTGWLAAAGTPQGFVTFFDVGGGASEVFVPISTDGGVPSPTDAGALSGFTFPGPLSEQDVRAVSDDNGGPGGVGAVLFSTGGASFAYVNADGLTHLGLGSAISHTYAAGDFVTISNYRGSFAISLYSAANQSTQLAASGCGP
jgi:hypothetical protein